MRLYKFLIVLIFSVPLLYGCSDKVVESDAGQVKSVPDNSAVEVIVDESSVDKVDEILLKEEPEIVEQLEQNVEEANLEPKYVEAEEESYPYDPEFSPQVQEAIDIMDGVAPAPKPAPELKSDYKEVAEVLESQISEY